MQAWRVHWGSGERNEVLTLILIGQTTSNKTIAFGRTRQPHWSILQPEIKYDYSHISPNQKIAPPFNQTWQWETNCWWFPSYKPPFGSTILRRHVWRLGRRIKPPCRQGSRLPALRLGRVWPWAIRGPRRVQPSCCWFGRTNFSSKWHHLFWPSTLIFHHPGESASSMNMYIYIHIFMYIYIYIQSCFASNTYCRVDVTWTSKVFATSCVYVVVTYRI